MIPTKFKRVFVFKTFTWNWRRGTCSILFHRISRYMYWLGMSPSPENQWWPGLFHKTFTYHWHPYSIGLYIREVIPLPLQISAIHLTIDIDSPTTPPKKKRIPYFERQPTHWHSQTLSYQHCFGLGFSGFCWSKSLQGGHQPLTKWSYITPISRLQSPTTHWLLGQLSGLCHS